MPLYEFECLDCGRQFEALVRDSTPPACPGCEGTHLERLLSLFSVSSESTRQSNLKTARQANSKVARDKAIAEHEEIHHHHH